MRKFCLLLGVQFLCLPLLTFGQVLFTVELQEDQITYLVKLRPKKSYASPLNITNSAQCSFVVPTGGFRPGNIKNIHGIWKNNNDIISPEKKPENDYLIFNLNGNISNMDYVEGKEIPLFSFQNIGKQTGSLDFVSKADVLFFKTKKINIGNQLSVLGAGRVNAFAGIYTSTKENTLPESEEYEEAEAESVNITYGQLASETFEFTTAVKNQVVHLEWLAGQMEQTASFIIEKSIDGIHFEPIQELKENNGYHFKETDEALDYGRNYYRIRQQFTSGTYRYSEIKEEAYYLDENSISLYPNPVRDHLSLRVGHFTKLEGQVHIFNRSGIEMESKILAVDNKQLTFNTSHFPGGLYFLVVQTKNQTVVERQFVVENGD